MTGTSGNPERIGLNGISVTSTAPPPEPPFNLAIASNDTPGSYDFTWDSQPGKIYDLLTSLDLATPVSEWPVYDDGEKLYEDIPATGTTTTLTAVPSGDPRRFFAMLEKDAPPLFFADFEDDDGGFTLVGTPNDWAWGAPDSDNLAGLVITTGNAASTNCWGTNLGPAGPPAGAITPGANSVLRSPLIDLTDVAGAQLSFAAAYDALTGDAIQVLVRDAATNDLLDTITAVATDGLVSSDWKTLGPFDLSAADDTPIHLEFRYQGSNKDYIGLYIDDVTVAP